MEQNQNGGVDGAIDVQVGGEGLGTPVPQDTVTPVPPVAVASAHGSLPPLLKRPSFRHIAVGLVFLLLLIAGGVFFVSNQEETVAVKKFTNVYAFVPEKVSKSAPIRIDVPEGVSDEIAEASITFSPEVAGEWVADAEEGIVVYKPTEALDVGTYYAVNMDAGTEQMSGDFYVDEDPRIDAIFPSAEGESHEDSEITIVFNRPMVPLTTLATQESVTLPITISPETPGRFKWISSRNLQFIPETTLVPSSAYTVTIGEGLVSMDGLQVQGMTHTFLTRQLRYDFISEGTIGYRSPMIVAFNQSVDLRETAKNITVEKASGERVGVDIAYGERTYYDPKEKREVTVEDQSKIFVYQKEDIHGRNGLWDFNTGYVLRITGAVPFAGTSPLTEGREQFVNVPDVIESVTAQSDRTSETRPDFFDPKGTLTIQFYDEINKDKTRIDATGLREVRYGERCETDQFGESVWRGGDCAKEEDPHVLLLSFNEGALRMDQSFDVELSSIYTKDGFKINTDTIKIPVHTYPPFAIRKTLPAQGERSARLDGMILCTNSPLQDPEEKGVGSYVKANNYFVGGRWSNSFYRTNESDEPRCEVGQFETELSYGLLPTTDYTLSLSLTDAFGQAAAHSLSFRTSPPTEEYTRFHNMQQLYNVTAPGKTTLTYAVENLEYVDMHLCKMSPETFLAQTLKQKGATVPPSSSECVEVKSERIQLPPKYWVNNYFQVDLATYFTDTRGQYVITFSNPLYKEAFSEYSPDSGKQLYDRTYVSVTNLAVGKKEVENGYTWSDSSNPAHEVPMNTKLEVSSNLYWVNNAATLAPVSGATVVQYTGGPKGDEDSVLLNAGGSGVTDGQGIARTRVDAHVVGAVIRSGAESAVVSDWVDTLQYSGTARDASRTYLYTDRPIYRPGHTVYMRGIDRIGFDGSYEVWNKEPVPIEIFDAEGTSIYKTTLQVGQYGTFNTSFVLPMDVPLGTYRIEAYGQNAYFDVEEYVPASFKLESVTDKEEYISGDTMKLGVQADYYFGVPVSEGKVSYSVTAQDYYFDRYTDEYFNFGGGWYYCYECGYGDSYLFRGETTLDENGRALIEKKFDLKEYFDTKEDSGSKLVTVSITVQDINGRSVSMQKSFIVHKGDFYIGAKTDEYYTGVNTPMTLRAKTVDLTGAPISLSGITRSVYKVRWDTFKRQEVDGGFYYRSEKHLDPISEEKIKTDSSGNWSGSLSFAEEGQYEIHLKKTDDRGNEIQSVTTAYIFGSRSVYIPPNNNYDLDLEVEQTKVNVGDTGSILIKSPYDTAKALITAERGTIYDYWVVDVKGGLYEHTFPVRSEYGPNMYLSVLLLSPTPEVKSGSVRFEVGSREHELSVEVTANKKDYLPGEKVELSIFTKDAGGKPVAAEVSLAVADLSVLALKGNPKKNPALFFYDGFPLAVTTASNIKNILYEVDIPLGSKGGGGASPDDLASKKRGLFKDTAFWEASVVTNAEGRASVTFTLPDNLTTWQVESLGVTKDTKLGVDYDEFTTKKELMAVPLKPRFVVPGDTFSLGAQVFNQTDAFAKVAVKLESSTLIFEGAREDTISLGAGESGTVYFKVKAPGDIRAGTHTFTFTASSNNLLDSVEQGIPVTPNTTYETVATANMTKETLATEYLYLPPEVMSGEGGLTINANATMAVFMMDALTYMATYPYGCSEQLASALSTIGTLTRALTIPNTKGSFDTIKHEGVTYTVADVVKSGLAKVYEAQVPEGGFGYYKGLRPDFYLTLHVATALVDLQEAGYEIRGDVLNRAARYLENEASRRYQAGNPTQSEGAISSILSRLGSFFGDEEQPAFMFEGDGSMSREDLILTEYVLRRIRGNTATPFTDIIARFASDKTFINEQISSDSLAYLALITADGFSQGVKTTVYDALLDRINIDGRGAYLRPRGESTGFYYETPTKNTALLLKAMVAHKDEHVMTGNILRWILASRDSRGVWGSTHNTFVVVDAFVDYLTWQHETESHFTLRGILDGLELFTHEFSVENIFETFTKFIPINDIARSRVLPLSLERTNLGDTKTGEKTNMYYDMALKYYLPVESLPPRDEGLTISRGLYALTDTREEAPLKKFAVGDVVRGKLTLTVPESADHIAIEDMIPAGFEIVNFNLATEDQSLLEGENAKEDDFYSIAAPSEVPRRTLLSRAVSGIASILGADQAAQLFGRRHEGSGGSYGNTARTLYPTHRESHDDRLFMYVDNLAPGVYESEYYLRALVPGTFQHMPARAEEMYFPEVFGRTEGGMVTITPGG